MKKKKQTVIMICPKCSWENEPIAEKSNENWKVVNPTCDKCNTRCTFKVVDEE